MNTIIRRRLEKLETAAQPTETIPTTIFSDHPYEDEEAAELLTDWRRLVAKGEATVSGSALCLLGPILTIDEWKARHVTSAEPESDQ